MKETFYSKIKTMCCIATCSGITLTQWHSYMFGTTKGNAKQIERLIRRFEPELYKQICYKNPYRSKCFKKDGLIIYTNSAIEYFFQIN
jgi:peptide subunit release factor RF-3